MELPTTPWDLSDRHWVWVGEIDSVTSARMAVEALSRGVGLDLTITVQGRVRHRLLEDLHELGDVVSSDQAAVSPDLDGDQRLLIEALVTGATLAQASRDLNWSRRTASRRLGEARATLGVETTAEAITVWAARSGQER